jgi:hypothetical protein
MIQTPPPAYHARGAGSPALLVLCAAAGLAALAALHASIYGLLRVSSLGTASTGDWVGYLPLGVTALALVYWRLAPRQSWLVLLLAGGATAIPVPLLVIAPEMFAPWMRDPYLILYGSCRPLLLVGCLAVATWVWRSGRRDAGAVLIGAVVAVPVLSGFLSGVLFGGEAGQVPAVVELVLAIVSLVVTIVAGARGAVARTDEPDPRPSWAATIGGAVAAIAPLVFIAWQPPPLGSAAPSADATVTMSPYDEFSQHMLVVGLIVLAAGVIGGIVAGPRVLTAGLAVGSLMGAISALIGPATADVYDLPAALPVTVVLLSLAAGIAVGLLRARLVVGLAGLGLLVVGLLVLYLVFTADDPIFDNDATNVITPILLVVGVIGGLAALTANGAVLAPLGEAPAAVAGVAGAITAGLSGVLTYFNFNSPTGTPDALGSYIPVMALIAIGAGLTVVAYLRWHRATPPAAPRQPAEAVPDGEIGTEPPADGVS